MRRVLAFFVAILVLLVGGSLSIRPAPAEAKPVPCVDYLPDGTPIKYFNPLMPCPGPPATIAILVPFDSTTCGSVGAVTITVVDKDDYDVDDGTPVSVTTTLGTALSGETFGGRYVASLSIPTKVAGTAELRVFAGAASEGKTVQVTCG